MAALDHEREVKSKRQYPVLVSVNIKGAFDNIQWHFIKVAMGKAPIEPGLVPLATRTYCVDSYLCNRKVLFMDRNKVIRFNVRKECPQGSCLGPPFWTLVADHILKSVTQIRSYIAFADNFLLLENAT